MSKTIDKTDVVIIGGGAAGFFAAIQAKTQAPKLSVQLLEAAKKPLGKVKISGGGRCNVTHHCFDIARLINHYPRGQKELRGIFHRFGPQETIDWFQSQGIKLKTEGDGRMFPVSDSSQTIVDALVQTAQEAGVQVHSQHPVKSLSPKDGGFQIVTPKKTWQAKAVILATGSAKPAYQWVQTLGHSLHKPVPSLFTFVIEDSRLQGLSGISAPEVSGKLKVEGQKPLEQAGPILITHWGLSGPVILRLSAWGARMLFESDYRATLVIDWCPKLDEGALRDAFNTIKSESPKKQMASINPAGLARRLWENLLCHNQLEPESLWVELSKKGINRLVESLKRCDFQVSGKGPFKEEFVTCGGVPLKEIDLKTMESRRVPGLYLVGELIDVDGLTGGFNFQNAWSTGFLAGQGVAGKLARF